MGFNFQVTKADLETLIERNYFIYGPFLFLYQELPVNVLDSCNVEIVRGLDEILVDLADMKDAKSYGREYYLFCAGITQDTANKVAGLIYSATSTASYQILLRIILELLYNTICCLYLAANTRPYADLPTHISQIIPVDANFCDLIHSPLVYPNISPELYNFIIQHRDILLTLSKSVNQIKLRSFTAELGVGEITYLLQQSALAAQCIEELRTLL